MLVIFGGAYYFKVVSIVNGFSIMNMNYDQEKMNNMVLNDSSVVVHNVTYYEIPFANKYFIAYDIINNNDLGNVVDEKGVFVTITDTSDELLNQIEAYKTSSNVPSCEERMNWLAYVFLGLSILILIFPTRKKEY